MRRGREHALLEAWDLIREHPEIGARYHGEIRCLFLRRFPFDGELPRAPAGHHVQTAHGNYSASVRPDLRVTSVMHDGKDSNATFLGPVEDAVREARKHTPVNVRAHTDRRHLGFQQSGRSSR